VATQRPQTASSNDWHAYSLWPLNNGEESLDDPLVFIVSSTGLIAQGLEDEVKVKVRFPTKRGEIPVFTGRFVVVQSKFSGGGGGGRGGRTGEFSPGDLGDVPDIGE